MSTSTAFSDKALAFELYYRHASIQPIGQGETVLLFDQVFTISMVEHDPRYGVLSIVALACPGALSLKEGKS